MDHEPEHIAFYMRKHKREKSLRVVLFFFIRGYYLGIFGDRIRVRIRFGGIFALRRGSIGTRIQ